MTEKSIINLLRSGKFTVIGQDSDCLEIYKGHIKYDQIVDDDGDVVQEEVIYEDNGGVGYVPEIVRLLVKALKGKVDSI